MKKLSTKAASILEAARQCDDPSPEIRTRVWEQMQVRAAAGDLGPELTELAEPATTTSVTSTKLLGWIAAATVGGGALVAGVAALDRDEPPESIPAVHEPRQAIETEAPSEAPLPPPEDPPEQPSTVIETEPASAVPEPAKRAPPKPAAKPATAAPESDFAAEVELMGRARAALGAGDATQALALLERHAKTFPRGTLGPERDVSRIMALCALGRDEQARKRAAAFMRRHAGTALAERVRRTCVGDDLR